MDPSRTPVVVGTGEVRGNRERDPQHAREPLALLREALALAAPAPLLALADAVFTVHTSSWPYDAMSARVATAVGAVPRHRVDSRLGGQWPVRLLDEAAARIARGESQVALVVGAEAQGSVAACRKAGLDPAADLGWTPRGARAEASPDLDSERLRASGLLWPTRAYALFENRLQADLGLTPQQGAQWSAALYADLSAVAADNPVAWSQEVLTAEQVGTVGPGNRMISEPYPLLQNAMPNVDQAAAVVVTSLAMARSRGVPEADLVHVWGGRGVDDARDHLDRPSYGASRALTECLARTVGLSPAPVGLVDVYSCFPVVPKLAGIALGRPRDEVLSATGGHAAFGGPMSSYSLHAVAALVRRVRAGTDVALVHANGGWLTYQHALLLGRRPHPDGYVGDPVPEVLEAAGPPAAPVVDGDLVVETATVEHDREGAPVEGFVVGRTAEGARSAASTSDPVLAARLSLAALPPGVTTHVGRRVRVTAREGAAVLTDLL